LNDPIKKLGPSGVSGDESEIQDGETVYVVYDYFWRHEEVGPFLRKIDEMADGTKRNEFGQRSRGNASRKRIPTEQRRVYRPGAPARGLPRNWYNPTFLNGLSDEKKRQLQMQKSVPLVHSPEVEA
jgi:hypothetical protein